MPLSKDSAHDSRCNAPSSPSQQDNFVAVHAAQYISHTLPVVLCNIHTPDPLSKPETDSGLRPLMPGAPAPPAWPALLLLRASLVSPRASATTAEKPSSALATAQVQDKFKKMSAIQCWDLACPVGGKPDNSRTVQRATARCYRRHRAQVAGRCR